MRPSAGGHGSGSCDAPQRAAERPPTGTEDWRQSQGGGGASYPRRPTGTEDSSTGGAEEILAEPGPQRSDRSQRHFPGDTHPTLDLPVLAGESGEVVDASALASLTRAVLEEKRKAEVEKAAKEKLKTMTEEEEEEEDPEGWREAYDSEGDLYFWHLRTRLTTWAPPHSSSSAGRRRKRKKKRNKKTPKTSSSGRWSSTVAVVCAWLVFLVLLFVLCSFLLKMLDTLAGMNQKDSYLWPVLGSYCW